MKELKIYFTSDIHGYVYPTDYTDNRIKEMGLLSIKKAIKKDRNTLVIDGGDTIQGSSFSNYLFNNSVKVNPIADIMNEIGYDYITLGNHDFNYGYDYLMSYINELDAKCLCANVSVNDLEIESPIFNYDIRVMESGLKIGLVGITTDYINVWEQKYNIENFTISDTYKAAKKYHDLIAEQVDLMIGIYHGGFEYDLETHQQLSETTENIAYKLAKSLAFDVLLTGHQHMGIVGKALFGTHIVQTPMNGLKFAEVSIQIDDKQHKTIESKLITPIVDRESDLYQQYYDIEEKVQSWLDQPIGQLDTPLTPKSHIEMAANGSLIASFVNQIQIEASGADISCTAIGNSVKGLPSDVTLRDIVSTYIYPNTLLVLEIDGVTLRKALERVGSYFAMGDKGLEVSAAFLKPKVEHYNYDYFTGIHYEFNVNNPVGNRLARLEYKGETVKDSDCFKLVMNNYRASGAGGYEFYHDAKILKDIQVSMTDIIVDYFRRNETITVDKTQYYKVDTGNN